MSAIRELREQHGGLELVEKRTGALRSLAASALEKRFAPSLALGALRGAVEDLGNGRVRVSYDFGEEGQTADFVHDSAYEALWRKWNAESGQPQNMPVTELTVAAGSLRGSGCVSYRLPLALQAPLEIKARAKYSYGGPGTHAAYLRLSACDDGKGNFVGCEGLGGLAVIDAATGLSETAFAAGGVELDPEHFYETTLSVDGKRARTSIDGSRVKELPCGSRTRGALYLCVNGNSAIALDSVAFEGVLALEETRAQWVAGELAKLGFASK